MKSTKKDNLIKWLNFPELCTEDEMGLALASIQAMTHALGNPQEQKELNESIEQIRWYLKQPISTVFND